MKKISIFSLKFTVALILMATSALAAEKSCDVDFMIKSARNTAIKTFIASKGYGPEGLDFSLTEYVGGGTSFGDCCWTSKSLIVRSKDSNEELARYKITVGNNWGDYQKGICEVTVSAEENRLPLSDANACQYTADTFATKVSDLLATAKAISSQDNSVLPYSILKDGSQVGILNLSPVECRFQSFQVQMQKLSN